MTENTCFGLYNEAETILDKEADLSLDFVVPLELISHWKKCSLVADFFANYQSLNFDDQQKAMSVLSTIINELLENAVKFTCDPNKLVSISLRRYQNEISIETVNITNKENAKKLASFIEKVEDADLEELFFEQIEEAAMSEHDASGVGLISIVKDYNAKLGLKIQEKPNESLFDVHVKVSLSADDLEAL
jgi:hypothetical protein